jgi:hypothetical protein
VEVTDGDRVGVAVTVGRLTAAAVEADLLLLLFIAFLAATDLAKAELDLARAGVVLAEIAHRTAPGH